MTLLWHSSRWPSARMGSLTRAACLILLVLSLPATLSGQAGVPTLTLGPQRFTTGDLELDDVRGAAVLTDGRMAIANAGSSNVLIVSRRGTVEKRLGRKGEGPGDFGGLNRLATFGDTIVTYDGLLGRVTLWRTDGTVIRSFPPEAAPGQEGLVSLEAIVSPSGYLATVRVYDEQPRNGLYLNSFALFGVRGTERTVLGTHPWSHSYFYAETDAKGGRGTASYGTPFLGATLVASAASKTLLLVIGEARVTVRRTNGTQGGVALPIVPVSGRERAKAYADAMIASVKDPDPDWVRKFRLMFGTNFPVVSRQAVAQHVVTVGGTVWFQEFRKPKDTVSTWWIVDARREALVGRLTLPSSSTILGGNDQLLLLLQTDSDGVQSVVGFDMPKY